ncbi:MAG: alpha/beta hydrolase [Anaerolineales bacterium]|nr:alpha/beta hydrolase [Anaerolineales bacterium]
MTTPNEKTEAQPVVFPLWPDDLPGLEDYPEIAWLAEPPNQIKLVRNVARPTLSVFLPDAAIANRTGVIICPGGAYHLLAVEHEGTAVARWLNTHGVTAFMLKYRVARTAKDDEEYQKQMDETMSDPDKMRELVKQQAALANADAQQAIRMVREHAAEWGVTPNRVGIMGFSAGAHVAGGLALQHETDSRPDFAAVIYGAIWEEIVAPADAPPLFIVLANNDKITAEPSLRIYNAWKQADLPVEMHSYAEGGHGFGMLEQGLPCDSWIERFGDWLKMQGLL